jgi:hypothetical protein
MSKKVNITKEKKVMLDGMMTVSQLEDGRTAADFMCCDDVEIKPFSGTFKVQGMHDGNIYMSEKPKRKRNHPVFREDNASLSFGSDKYWYFVFRTQNITELPGELIRQASIIARKVIKELLKQ